MPKKFIKPFKSKPLRKTVFADHKKLMGLVKNAKQDSRILDTVVACGPSATATVTMMTLIGQGTNNGDREGSKITLEKLDFRYAIELTPAVSTPVCTVRVIYLLWVGSLNTVLPPISQILTVGTNVLSDYNYLYHPDFRVLYDKMHNVSAVEARGNTVRKVIKLKTVATYVSTVSTGYDKNHIVQIVLSDQATSTPTFTSYTRLYYQP